MEDATTTAPATIPPAPFTPAQRQLRPAVEGIGVVLADGQEWRLAPAGLAPMLDRARDQLFDHSVVRQTVPMALVLQVAWVCLLANYRLADGELAALLTGLTDDQERGLVDAVMDGLFGPGGKPHRTYTGWALASLYANGLDPKSIPAAVVPDVLEVLLRTGRAIAQDEWISSVKHQATRANILEMFERSKELQNMGRTPPPAG